jgi:hypothetical protein
MTPEEMGWMRRVGQAKYFKPSLFSINCDKGRFEPLGAFFVLGLQTSKR